MNLLLKDAIILSLFGTNTNKYNNQTNTFINIQEYDIHESIQSSNDWL